MHLHSQTAKELGSLSHVNRQLVALCVLGSFCHCLFCCKLQGIDTIHIGTITVEELQAGNWSDSLLGVAGHRHQVQWHHDSGRQLDVGCVSQPLVAHCRALTRITAAPCSRGTEGRQLVAVCVLDLLWYGTGYSSWFLGQHLNTMYIPTTSGVHTIASR